MGNDLKYGLVLGVVVLLLFVGYMAIKTHNSNKEAEPIVAPSAASSQASGPLASGGPSPTGTNFDIMATPTQPTPTGTSAGAPAIPSQGASTGVSPAPIVNYEIGKAPAPIAAPAPAPVRSSTAGQGPTARPGGLTSAAQPANRRNVVLPTVGNIPPVSPNVMVSQDLSGAGAAKPEPVATSVATSQKTYTVAKGDHLATIAKKYYGDENKWQKIVDANKGLDPNRLKVGQKIVIPDLSAETGAKPTTSTSVAEAPGAPTASGKTYVVQAHDTLYKIAVKFYKDGSQWKKILSANKDKLSSASQLKVGMKLTIP